MKRLILIVMVLLLLAGIGIVAWTVAGLPPVEMVWRYGFLYWPSLTGRELTVEGIEFVEIGAGCFPMGSHRACDEGNLIGRVSAPLGLDWGRQPSHGQRTMLGWDQECPVHWVEIPRGFWIARTELTNDRFEVFAPLYERSESSPGEMGAVVDVSWEDAKEYCSWLSGKSGLSIRLPSESEWECGCRAGSEFEYCFGENEKRLGEYAWHDANSKGKAHEVGTRRANAWGLHDFHGNVLEWCEDTWHPNYEDAPADGTAWTQGGKLWQGGPSRVSGGGCFCFGAEDCRSARRGWCDSGLRWWYLGFRPAYWPPLDH
jgi:formylglycine-generating enzyme required for sulfatase activity